jgi:pimeloyl-ACP methyl ester carboxylesterase
MSVTPAGETKFIETADGRTLAYIEFGDPGSPLVIHNHGGPSSRLEGRLLADGAISNGLRLVSVDRPGIGRSTAQKNRSYEGWADDMVAIADALGYQEFGISGWSEGGPWPLAAAFYLDPARLRHVTSIAGGNYGTFGEMWAQRYMGKVDTLGGRLALHHKLAFHLMYEILDIDASHFRHAYIKSLSKMVNDYDAKLLGDPEIAAAFAEMSAECFVQGSEPLVDDAELLYHRWPFDVTKIERPVHMWQGTDDHLVPYPINKEISDRMPGSVWHEVEGGGHLIALGKASEIFAIAAKELRQANTSAVG